MAAAIRSQRALPASLLDAAQAAVAKNPTDLIVQDAQLANISYEQSLRLLGQLVYDLEQDHQAKILLAKISALRYLQSGDHGAVVRFLRSYMASCEPGTLGDPIDPTSTNLLSAFVLPASADSEGGMAVRAPALTAAARTAAAAARIGEGDDGADSGAANVPPASVTFATSLINGLHDTIRPAHFVHGLEGNILAVRSFQDVFHLDVLAPLSAIVFNDSPPANALLAIIPFAKKLLLAAHSRLGYAFVGQDEDEEACNTNIWTMPLTAHVIINFTKKQLQNFTVELRRIITPMGLAWPGSIAAILAGLQAPVVAAAAQAAAAALAAAPRAVNTSMAQRIQLLQAKPELDTVLQDDGPEMPTMGDIRRLFQHKAAEIVPGANSGALPAVMMGAAMPFSATGAPRVASGPFVDWRPRAGQDLRQRGAAAAAAAVQHGRKRCLDSDREQESHHGRRLRVCGAANCTPAYHRRRISGPASGYFAGSRGVRQLHGALPG
jgi:hypothetical protein